MAKPAATAEPGAAASPGGHAGSAGRAVAFPAHPKIWSPLVSHLAGEVDLETVLGAGQSRPAADDLGAGLTGVTGTGPDNPVREAESRGPQTFGPGQTPRCRPA